MKKTTTKSTKKSTSRRLSTRHKALIVSAVFLAVFGVIALVSRGTNLAVLRPSGMIATQQRDLMMVALGLMMIVVIPVFIMTAVFAVRYRASNKRATYAPEWDHNTTAEAIWWGVPFVIVAALAVITWVSTFQLDPYRPLESDKTPVTIEVVAMEWKWLFIYPEHDIATVNYIQVPENVPLHFKIIADAPMNSFWIPELGGQIYAMNGMETQLYLKADKPGRYDGLSANISGEGFASMKFVVEAVGESDYANWVDSVRGENRHLSLEEYDRLAEPSSFVEPILYSSRDEELYDSILMKYMIPPADSGQSAGVLRPWLAQEGRV